MITDNTLSEIGDILIISSEIPVVGVDGLTSFSDSVSGETGTRFFIKSFRYSIDSINFTDWIELTDPNLAAVDVSLFDLFFIEYKYERGGTDTSGLLTFNSISLTGTYSEEEISDGYRNSIFYDLIGAFYDIDILTWYTNVLRKFYDYGIVPKFIVRKNFDYELDRDYIDFWRISCRFFATIVSFARKLENFKDNEELLKKYLSQKGLYFCNQDTLYSELLYLMRNYYDEIRQRGTQQIYKKKGTVLGSDKIEDFSVSFSYSESISDLPTTLLPEKQVDGELLRLICYNSLCDEFIFNLRRKEHFGWVLGSHSPLFRGLTYSLGVNKSYEQSRDIIDLDLYPLRRPEYITRYFEDNKWVIRINNIPYLNSSGIGQPGNTVSSYEDYLINVDPSLDYEITFWVKSNNLVNNFTFGCRSYDRFGNENSLVSVVSGLDTDDKFFQKITLSKEDTWYFVRGIIYNKDKELLDSTSGLTNLGVGENLKFTNTDQCKILPHILFVYELDSVSDSMSELIDFSDRHLSIWDLKIRPVSTPYSTGFIQAGNFIDIWMEQNNHLYTKEQIEEIMRKFLLPYNTAFKNIYVENE